MGLLWKVILMRRILDQKMELFKLNGILMVLAA